LATLKYATRIKPQS